MMMTWEEFTASDPALAAAGEGLIFQFGVGLAFLATIRKDGGPRLHPVCPVLAEGRLYLLIQPRSPKKYDLLRDGRYALQSFPPPRVENEEFYLAGRAELVEEPSMRAAVLGAAKHQASPDEILFELKVERAMHTTWENYGTPQIRPVHKRWGERDGGL